MKKNGMSKKKMSRVSRLIIGTYVLFLSGFSLCSYLMDATPKIFVNSVPKSGTHLTRKLVILLTGKQPIVPYYSAFYEIDTFRSVIETVPDHQFIQQHIPYTDDYYVALKAAGYRGSFVYRDPRDVIISLAHYILCDVEKWPSWQRYTPDKLISFIIEYGWPTSDTHIVPFVEQYSKYLDWREKPDLFYALKFEDLVGDQGGGDTARQKEVIRGFAAHLRVSLTDQRVDDVSQQLFGNQSGPNTYEYSPTFREGKIGAWRTVFTDEHKQLFRKFIGSQLLIDLGYEHDDDW